MSEAIGLAGEAAKLLRGQRRPDMAAAVETLRAAAMVASHESITPSRFARLLGMHRNTVRNWAEHGWIEAVKVGRRGDLRIPKAEVERWLQLDRELEAGIGWPTEQQIRSYLAMRRRANRATKAQHQ